MTVGYYLNIEVVARESIEDFLDRMTDSNVRQVIPDDELLTVDDDALRNNLKYGFNALVMMYAFAECIINDLVHMKYQEMFHRDEFDEQHLEQQLKNALRKSLSDKVKDELGISCSYDRDPEFAEKWSLMIDTIKIRNELIHYKSGYMQECTIPDPCAWWLPGIIGFARPSTQKKVSIGDAFTQTNMRRIWKNIWNVLAKIADKKDCVFAEDIQLVSSDGRDGFASFVIPKDIAQLRASYS